MRFGGGGFFETDLIQCTPGVLEDLKTCASLDPGSEIFLKVDVEGAEVTNPTETDAHSWECICLLYYC